MADRRRSVRLAVPGEQEHEIDVGGEVELATAELAHADHHERHRLAVRVGGAAVAGGGERPGLTQRERNGIVRKRGEVLEGLLERGGSRKVAPGDAYHLAAAPATQPRLPLGFGCAWLWCTPLRPASLAARCAQPIEGSTALEVGPKRRIAREGFGHERAAGEHLSRRITHRYGKIISLHIGFPTRGASAATAVARRPPSRASPLRTDGPRTAH